MTTSDDGSTAIRSRYRDAYSVAASTVSWGGLLKVLAFVAAVLIFFGAAAADLVGQAAYSVVLFMAVIIGGMLYALGVVVMVQGQIFRATLDTAVNTSPLLSIEQKRDILVPRHSRDRPSN